MTQYEVATGAIALPGRGARLVQVRQGEIVPEGLLSEREIESLLADGRIQPIKARTSAPPPKAPVTRGKWSRSPASCAGKTMEDLLLEVLVIDPNYDVNTLEDEAAAVRLLTSDWHPEFDDDVARAIDRTAPSVPTTGGARRGAGRDMADSSAAAIARAREQAQSELAEKGVQE